MIDPSDELSQEDYVSFLENELAKQWDVIGSVQEFFVHFSELLEMLEDLESTDSPFSINSDLHAELFEKLVDKCAKALEDFKEKTGGLINLED